MLTKLITVSSNSKTGPIPVSKTERASCAPTCPFKGICYEEYGHLKGHWNRVETHGEQWDTFTARIKMLPRQQLWRHNEAGDLPHIKGTINRAALRKLLVANKGKRGFTYTHHELTPSNVKSIKEALAQGFTINVSCETLEQVDHARSLGLPATIVVARNNQPAKGAATSAGHPLRQCPAETTDMTCARCGICQRADRHTIIYFTAHGAGAKRIEAVLADRNMEK
jgi:hypothetical protein